MGISAKDVKELRDMTGAGMMDCKRALSENSGDVKQALSWLREKGMAKAAKRQGKVAAEGAISSYIHMGGKIGVLVEVNCETDFVARGEEFKTFVKEICLQICSTAPLCVREEEVPREAYETEKAIYVKQAAETGKPADICVKIAEGKLKKWLKGVCLMDQPWVKDNDKTIEDLRQTLSGTIGEKIDVRRFVRFQLGEGIEKKEVNFAEEVAAELKKAEAKKKP